MRPFLRRPGIVVAIFLTLTIGVTTWAALPAPEFLPGQPMMVGTQVLLIWAPIPGASAYAVYQNGTLLQQVPSNQVMVPAPTQGGEYHYQVATVDRAGVVGPRGAPGLVRIRVLTAPRGLIARSDPGAGTIGLVWDKVVGAAIYNVYRAIPGGEEQLAASVQDTRFIDADVKNGQTYAYRVSARDLTGTEGPRSTPASARNEKPAAATEQRSTFRAQPTEIVLELAELAGTPLRRVSDLRVGPEGELWVVTPQTHQVQVIDSEGNVTHTLGPFAFSETGFSFLPHKLDFAPGGDAFVTDARNGVLARLDEAGDFVWTRGLLTPPPDDARVWGDFGEHLKFLSPTPSSVLAWDDEVWVTDQRFQLIYRFAPDGNLLGYLTHAKKDGREFRLPGVGELTRLPGDRALLTFPLSHYAVITDRHLKVLVELGTEARSPIGGFVGIHGVQPLPDDEVLLSDPAAGSLQVFDTKTGAYRYHLSGPTPQRDPAYRGRADLPIRRPNLATVDDSGRIWVYDGSRARLLQLKATGAVTPALP